MILYSVTVTIDSAVENDWLPYMQQVHIPEVIATGFFESYTFQKLLEPQPEAGTVTYNIQYVCESADKLEVYRRDHAPSLQADHTLRFKERFVAFRTVLEILD